MTLDTLTPERLVRYSPKQVAEMIGNRSTPFVLGLIHTGKLRATREGRIYFITPDAVREYLDGQAPAAAES